MVKLPTTISLGAPPTRRRPHESLVALPDSTSVLNGRFRVLGVRWRGMASLRLQALDMVEAGTPVPALWLDAELLTDDVVADGLGQLIGAGGLRAPADAPVLHWTKGVEVRIGRPRFVR